MSYNDEILDHKIDETLPSKISISFKEGTPFAINGDELGGEALLSELNKYGIVQLTSSIKQMIE